MTEKFSLKDFLFNPEKVQKIAEEIFCVYPVFKKHEFIREVLKRFPELELKARITWIADCLKTYLPADYKRALDILLQALPKENNPDLTDDDFGDFIYACYSEYVAKNGCSAQHLQISLLALKEITKRFSCEDAMRYFLNAFAQETLKELLKWTTDSHYHVRRLCSESTRPKLPWSAKINIPINAPLPILDQLFFDPTRFVTRSVANHVNDISKIDPDLSLKILKRWKKSGQQKKQEMDYIVSHALRTLIKQGHGQAMEMLGMSVDFNLTVDQFTVPKKVKMNTALNFSFELQAEQDLNLIVDYILYFQNKSGQLNSKKVFKLKQCFLKKGQRVLFQKSHLLRQFMTTRTLYSGEHALEIQINGKKMAKRLFDLQLS